MEICHINGDIAVNSEDLPPHDADIFARV